MICEHRITPTGDLFALLYWKRVLAEYGITHTMKDQGPYWIDIPLDEAIRLRRKLKADHHLIPALDTIIKRAKR